MKKLSPAVFLDRDGTILKERGYLGDPRKMNFYPSAFHGLRRLQRRGFKLVVVTNQSGVGRGYFTLAALRRVNSAFKRGLLKAGVRLSGIYFCPHLPGAGCSCRKPKPGLARLAARDLHLDLKKSFVIGDQPRDMEMASRMGAMGILVLTGAGRSTHRKAARWSAKKTLNLTTAAQWIQSQL